MIALDKRADTERASLGAAVPVVRAAAMGKSFDRRVVLDDISLEIAPGSFVALLGANGAGKTTLLHILATLTRPSHGTLELFGVGAGAATTRPVRARIGMIGHQPMLYRDLTALENLEFFGRLYGLADPRRRALDLLEHVSLLARAGDAAGTFSRGMIQRLAIARALMHDPELLLADEPFAGLDVPSTRTVENLLTAMHAEGRTIVLSNHDVPQSLALAKRVIVLRRGRVALDVFAEHASVAAVTQEVVTP